MSRSVPSQSQLELETVTAVDGPPSEGGRSSSVSPAPGEALGRYVVLGTLGRGGMGVVLRAYDPRLQREVALKRLRSDVLETGAAERMVREGQAMAQLAHPNVVAVYDVEWLESTVLLAMELVRGRTLRQWLRDRSPPPPRVIEVFVQAGRGLAAAHAAGLVHRDFKPANVLVGDDGRVRVTDFGLARLLGEPPSADDSPGASSHRVQVLMTEGGAVMGTPAYMAPEQHFGEDADAKADQYAFCVALWEALRGARPFSGDPQALAAAKARGAPPWPRELPVARRVVEAMLRGLSPDPKHRWPSMDALLAELDRDPARQRLRRITTGAVVVAAMATVGAAVSWWSRGAAVCEGAALHLAELWDDARRAQVEASLRATGVGYAEVTRAEVIRRLDAYARDWARMHTEACEATAVRHEQSAAVLDLRMQCLQHRRDALAAAVEVLVGADASVAEGAIGMVAELPGLGGCADVDALQAAVPPPDDPALAEAVDEARRALARGRAIGDVGKHADGLAILDALPPEALAYEPLRAEAETERGLLLLALGRYEQAEAALDDAAQRALRLDHRRVAVQALAGVGFTVGVRRMRRDEGMWLVRTALAMAESLDDPLLEALVLNDVAGVLEAHGDYDEAIDRYELALAIQREHHGEEHPAVTSTLTNLALAWEGRGQLERAFELHTRALEIDRSIFGEEHPRVARLLTITGIDLHQLGRYEASAERLEQALTLQRRLLGPAHPETARTLASLGLALSSLGRHADAEARLRQALENLERELGPEQIEVVDALDNLAIAVDAQGRHDEALRLHRRVLDAHERILGPTHPRVAVALNNVASVLVTQRRYEEALPVLERAITVERETLGPEHPHLAIFELNVGDVLLGLGRVDEAEERYRRATPIVEAAFGPDHVYVSYGVVGQGRVHLARGEPERAVPLLERGLTLRAAHGVPEAHRAEAAFALARALGPDERARARTLAKQARASFASAGPGSALELAEVDAWLAEHRAR